MSGLATAGALRTAENAAEAIGRGFDANNDTRLLYCKGGGGGGRGRLVEVDEEHVKDLWVYDDVVAGNVSRDIGVSQVSGGRQQSGICTFLEMVEYFNKKAGLSSSPPLGCFNSAFSFTGSKHIDSVATKTLSADGFYIPLAKFELCKSPLGLREYVRRAIPSSWDPASLASFIENFGTHIITSVTIGGKDMVYVKQHQSSPLTVLEIKNYVQDLGNQRFSNAERHTSLPRGKTRDKIVDPHFSSQGIYPQPSGAPYLTGKEDVTVIFRRRGGDDLEQNHVQWAGTVPSSPDIIEMTFCPITDLLDGLPGKEYLARAINLYLEYKPQIEELRYFLEFQIPRVWAPSSDKIPGIQRKEPVCPSLQFSMMGQKLYVSQEQVSVGRKPVIGIRLRLEGSKLNRLCIQLQHLASLPKIFQPYWDAHIAIGAPKWQGPEEQDSRWFEPVKWKNFSHVSTAPIENPESFVGDVSGIQIVTGAQLGVWDFGSRNVLYMRLLYSCLPGCTIRRSKWDHAPNNERPKDAADPGNSSDSSDSSSGSGEKSNGNKLAKFVDMTEMGKGPQDPPGHWLVTGGKLGVEKGKIVLRVKYSLLNY
ncbi:hypothetical protein MLD38_023937 [Melastoma candidum]|uniref:Uncharacterized protein n=1 Tax=Melastoma candidum TaxID=119954 RepID=A0ACB9NR43_9MYRT|nr:hypothetical protein MLD38_023937 [Melastoma candidum]